MGEKYGIVSKSGANYSYGETKLGKGYDASRTFLKENPEILGEIRDKVKEKMLNAD